MARHSLVAYRNQSERNKQLVTFAGDEWLDYVPIRMSDVVSVQDHLPSGAAAVLINQTLTFKDLFLPVGPTEKRWFDAYRRGSKHKHHRGANPLLFKPADHLRRGTFLF